MAGTHPATSSHDRAPVGTVQFTRTGSDRTKRARSEPDHVRNTPPRQSFGTARRNPNQEATWAHPLARGELS